jgi:anti-anti-sigma factor
MIEMLYSMKDSLPHGRELPESPVAPFGTTKVHQMLDDLSFGSRKAVPDAFRVKGHAGLDEVVLVLEGQADAAAAPLLAHALSQASSCRHGRVIVDLADLEFMDTQCLAIIFGVQRELRDRGGEVILRSPRPSVRRLLDILERQDLIENRQAR